MAATKPVVPSRPLPAPPPSPISASSPPLSLPSLSIITHPPAPSISDAPSTSTARRPPPPLLSPLSGSSSMSRRSSIADTPRSSTSSMAPPSTPLGPPPSLPLPDLPPFPSPIDPKIALSLANVSRGGGVRSIDTSRPSLSRRVSEGLVSLSSIPPSPTTSVRSKADSFSHTNPGNNATLPRRLPSSASLSVSGSTGRHRSGRAPRPISTASAWSVASANSQMSFISAASEALGQSMAELDREAEEMGILLPSSSSGYASASGGSGSERERLSKSLGPSSGRSSRRSSRSHHHHAHARPSMPPTSYSSSYLQQQQPSSVPPLSAPPAISESPYHQQHLPQPPPLSPTSSASSSAHPHSLRSTASAPLLATTLRKVSLRSLYPPTPTGAADLPSPREDDEISGDVSGVAGGVASATANGMLMHNIEVISASSPQDVSSSSSVRHSSSGHRPPAPYSAADPSSSRSASGKGDGWGAYPSPTAVTAAIGMGTAANPAPPVSPSISAVFSSGRRKDSTASTTVPPSITSATPAATSPTSSTTPTSPRSPPADADTMLSSMLRSMAANVSSSKNTPHSRTQTPAHALESSAGPKPNINKPLPVASSTRSSRANSVASASGPTIPGPSSTSHPNSTPTTMASTSSFTSTQAIPTSRLRTKSGSGSSGVPSSFRGSAVPASGSAGMSEQPTVRASSASSDAAGNTKPNPQLATRGRSHSIRSPTAPPPPSSFSASVPSTPAAGSKPSRIARRSASNTSLSSANGASSNAKPNPTPTSASSGGRMTMTEAALAHAALSGRTSPDVNDLLKSTPRPGKKKSNASLRTAVTGSSASASASVRSGRGHSVSRSTSRASAQRRASGTGSEADGDATVPSSVAGAKKKKKHSLRGSASAPNALSSGPSTSVSAVPPVPSLPSAYPHSSSLTSTSTSTPHHQPSVASSSARHQLSETTRRATQGMKMDLSSTPSVPADLVSPTESTGDDAWMTPASSSDYEDEDEDGHAWTRRRLSDLDVDPNGDEAKAGGLGEDDGEGSGSDESSIDLKTPLPQILVRDGMLSPSSTVVRSHEQQRASSTDGASGSASPGPNAVRKVRHRDGKLLREGVGLTTGLGWSDSEDENSPGPLRRRLSRLMLLKRVDSVSSSLAGVAAAVAAAGAGSSEAGHRAPSTSPPPASGAAYPNGIKPILRKTTSSATIASANGAGETLSMARSSRPNTPGTGSNSILSANPSLDAKVKALLARAEAYKKETQARLAAANGSPSPPSGSSSPTVPTGSSVGMGPRPSLSRSSTNTTASASSSVSSSSTAPPSSYPISGHGSTTSRSSFSSLKLRAPSTATVAEEAEDAEFAAAESAYRQSKELSSSTSARNSARYSTSTGRGSIVSGSGSVSAMGRGVRAASSVGSRDSIYSTASSGVTEFGVLNSSSATPPVSSSAGRISIRTRSATSGATVSGAGASAVSPSSPPPSAFHFPAGALAPIPASPLSPTHPTSPSTAASSSPSALKSYSSMSAIPPSSMRSSSTRGSISSLASSTSQSQTLYTAGLTPSLSNSTAVSSTSTSPSTSWMLMDADESTSRIAKLSNASTTSVSSNAAPSLFSLSSSHSTSTDTSDVPPPLPRLSTSLNGTTTDDAVNVIPPSPTSDSTMRKFISASSMLRKPLPRRPSLQPLSTDGEDRRVRSGSATPVASSREATTSSSSLATPSLKPRKSSLSSSSAPPPPSPRTMMAMDMEFPTPPSHTTPRHASSGGLSASTSSVPSATHTTSSSSGLSFSLSSRLRASTVPRRPPPVNVGGSVNGGR